MEGECLVQVLSGCSYQPSAKRPASWPLHALSASFAVAGKTGGAAPAVDGEP
jgi:hypothetical protein